MLLLVQIKLDTYNATCTRILEGDFALRVFLCGNACACVLMCACVCMFVCVRVLYFGTLGMQEEFLTLHDRPTQRLWFLWQSDKPKGERPCGCCGNCLFVTRLGAGEDDEGGQNSWTEFTSSWLDTYSDGDEDEGVHESSVDDLTEPSVNDSSSDHHSTMSGLKPVEVRRSIYSSDDSKEDVTTPCRVMPQRQAEHDGTVGGNVIKGSSQPGLQRFLSSPATARVIAKRRSMIMGDSLSHSTNRLVFHSATGLAAGSRSSLMSGASDVYYSCEDVRASVAEIPRREDRRKMFRRLSRHTMSRASSTDSFQSARASVSIASMSSVLGARSESSGKNTVATVADKSPGDTPDSRVEQPADCSMTESLDRVSPLAKSSARRLGTPVLNYAECLDAVCEEVMDSPSPVTDGSASFQLREEIGRKRVVKSFSLPPMQQSTKHVHRTPVLTRSACGSPTSNLPPQGRSAGKSSTATHAGYSIGRSMPASLPNPGSIWLAGGTEHSFAVRPLNLDTGVPPQGNQEMDGNVREDTGVHGPPVREVRATVSVSEGVDVLVTPLVLAAMQR